MPPIHYLRLHELAERVHNAIAAQFTAPVWVVAEIASIREAPSGHCYLELTEFDTATRLELSSMRAMIWAKQYATLRPYFESMTQTTLRKGLQLLLRVKVEYSVRYGMGLQVVDIDPQYTVGELAIQRQKTLAQLEADGVIEMNRALPFPEFPHRLAVISAAQAAGYEDFCHQLAATIERYHLQVHLFPALMQGDKASASIREALYQIADQEEAWDAVIIIRGGGGKMDLSCFDDYELAAVVAQFPLPIIAGIGHERDVSVVDYVAHTSLKTPTAVAAAIEERFASAEGALQRVVQTVVPLLEGYTAGYAERVQHLGEVAEMRATHLLSQSKQALRLQIEGKELTLHTLLAQYMPRLQHLAEKGTMLAQHGLDTYPQQLQSTMQGATPAIERALQQTRMDYLVTLAEAMTRDPRQALRNGYALLHPTTMAATGDQLEVVTQAATYRVEVLGVEKSALFSDGAVKGIKERMEEFS